METCSFCGKQFSKKSHLYCHLRNIYKSEPTLKGNLKCSDCNNSNRSYADLREHYISVHNYEIFKEIKEFNTEEEFFSWKEAKEKDMKCSYVKNSGMKCGSENFKMYYVCHRSARNLTETSSIVKHKKKMPKSQGSSKLMHSCPSTLEFLKKDGKYVAILYTPHIGHICSLRHINLTKTEKTFIAGKIAEGVSFQKILDDIRDSVKSGTSLERIHLLDRQDLRNVKKEFSLDTHVQFHKNDALSVHLWTESMKKLGTESPVLFYKPQGSQDPLKIFKEEDFILIIMTNFQRTQLVEFGTNKICIDSTHGTNNYDFLLTSVVIVDNFGVGIPVAFLLSNRTDTVSLTHFLKVIADDVGCIKTKVFMSDDAPEFYNSWVSVMCKPDHQLLCAWHVDKNWRKNIQKIHGSQELKVKIYKTLYMLVQEQNIEKFEETLEFVTSEFLSDEDLKNFGEYFQTYYARRPRLWAHCYRKGLGINTNMYLEALHKNLKYVYLEGKKNKRIDKCINSLMKLIRDLMFKTLKKNIKGNNSYRMNLIQASHMKSFNIEGIFRVDNNSWRVKSSTDDTNYIICKSGESCTEKSCALFCKECKICIHDFSCTCPDFHIKFNICKHIHAVSSKLNILNVKDESTNPEKDSQELVQLVANHNIQYNLNDNKERLKSKLDILYGLVSQDYDESTMLLLEKSLDKVIDIATKGQGKLRLLENKYSEPANKNVERQMRFKSTKRKRASTNNTFKKPNNEEKKNFHETLNNRTDDHSYAKSEELF